MKANLDLRGVHYFLGVGLQFQNEGVILLVIHFIDEEEKKIGRIFVPLTELLFAIEAKPLLTMDCHLLWGHTFNW